MNNKPKIKTSFTTRIKTRFIKLAKENSSVNEIATGAALGAFTGVFPSFGFGFLTVLLLHRFFKFNIFAAATGSLISNPLTSPLFMLLSFETGELLLNTDVRFDMHNWSANLKEAGYSIFIGAIAVSSFCSFATYFITKYIVIYIRNRQSNSSENY
ncbi:DUF2062 domain-containing protein [Pedobacter aquae]|uniref:DUF2062 domain-containing protein n=2 Tax=Bacteroidota TaxID=976 RepID=A0A5C0VIP6_9SPHI|nr:MULTISPECIES: DUF2062 domain-containing protein [Bacteroidota]MBS4040084.1 DUF2062 domain-containing protein [Flavobacteriales bacterium]MBS4072363.1 DUF2062 domain-containing protein [Algoriphagus sp.]MCP1385184.1 DUF2062 domain-containing protein [Runella salmonicolor]QEK50894.1 DUF2062 domain-containing protein [Pedobacter aquae]RPD43400.1 DUF2062 domain-containing protein [Paracnuella aquatica]